MKKLLPIIFLVILGCQSPANTLIGKWEWEKKIINGKEIPRSTTMADDIVSVMEFVEKDNMFYYVNGCRSGIGRFFWGVQGDTLYAVNVSYEPQGTYCTTTKAHFIIIGDTLKLQQDSVTTIFSRSNLGHRCGNRQITAHRK